MVAAAACLGLCLVVVAFVAGGDEAAGVDCCGSLAAGVCESVGMVGFCGASGAAGSAELAAVAGRA